MQVLKCRSCHADVKHCFLDLGIAPPSNALINSDDVSLHEKKFPLRVFVCDYCWLAQTEDFVRPDELFNADYSYFSGFSSTWLYHCRSLVEKIVEDFSITSTDKIFEVASNDGTLLEIFESFGFQCLGIEPTRTAAQVSRKKGLLVIEEFIGLDSAKNISKIHGKAQVVIANNVLAHVPDINDFIRGCLELLDDAGIAIFEFQSLFKLMEKGLFDTIYHEHFSYLSFTAAFNIFSSLGLTIIDVEEVDTHGGSLRVFAQHSDSGVNKTKESVSRMLNFEEKNGVKSFHFYKGLQEKANECRKNFLDFLQDKKNEESVVIAYGAAAKGNTLLNFSSVDEKLIKYVVDRNIEKQGKYLPGSKLLVVSENRITEDKPDYVVVLPWNISSEISEQLTYVEEWGGKLVTAVPRLKIL
ncbi:MAG: class I SAM-dependent methyltransferase [Nitrospinota bacterium]|nr:class I SAM-dependent methyltransferase [Nitrospinota bacterium]